MWYEFHVARRVLGLNQKGLDPVPYLLLKSVNDCITWSLGVPWMRQQSWVPPYSGNVNTKWATYVNTTILAEELATAAILIVPMRPVVLIVNPSISLLLSYMKHIWLVLCLLVCFFRFYGTGDRPSSSFMLGKRSALSCTPNPHNPSCLKWLCQLTKIGKICRNYRKSQ